MMSMATEWRRRHLFQLQFDCQRRPARRQAGAVGDAEDVGVHRDRLRPERDVHHHIGGLAADAGQLLQRVAILGHASTMLGDQPLGECDDVLGLHVEQPDGSDVPLQPILAQRDHLLRGLHRFEQLLGGFVDADIGRLGGEHHRDQQRIGIDVGQFGFRRRIVLGKTAEEFEDVRFLHRPSTSPIR